MKPNTKAFLALIFGLSFMCFAAIFIKAAKSPGLVTVFYRMGAGTLFLVVPFLLRRKASKDGLSKRGITLAVVAGICFGFDMYLWSKGVVETNATIPTLFANLAPVWVGFGAIFIFKEKKRLGFWIGLFVAVAGVFILVSKDLTSSNGLVRGMLLGLFAGIFYAAFYLFSQAGRKLLDTLSFLFLSTLAAACVLGVMMLFSGYTLLNYDLNTYLMFLGLSLGVQVIGWFLINYSQGFLSASVVAPTLLGQPVLTGLLAFLLLEEKLGYLHIIGGLVVVIGIYLVHFYRTK